jgi:predicted nucleic acid-binding protein
VYLLDTNIISEARKPKPHGGVIAWLQGIPDQEMRLSAATLGELQNGVEITRRQNREKAIQIEKWIDQVAATYQVLPVDGNVFREWGRLIKQPEQLIDSLLAATARIHRLTLVTRNTRDFQSFHVPTLNPFTAKP